MQQAPFSQTPFSQTIFSQTPFSQAPCQATRIRTQELEARASNDDSFGEDGPPWRTVLCVLANALGGAILLSGMFILPHIIARILA